MKTFVNNALADSMLPACTFRKDVLDWDAVRAILAGGDVVSVFNPTHINSLHALQAKHGVVVPVGQPGTKITLKAGDRLLVIGINNLPRETREFTDAEVAKASFTAALYTILS